MSEAKTIFYKAWTGVEFTWRWNSEEHRLAAREFLERLLVLLRHNVSDMRVTVMQHGHRSSFRTSSTISVRRMVEIEFAT